MHRAQESMTTVNDRTAIRPPRGTTIASRIVGVRDASAPLRVVDPSPVGVPLGPAAGDGVGPTAT